MENKETNCPRLDRLLDSGSLLDSNCVEWWLKGDELICGCPFIDGFGMCDFKLSLTVFDVNTGEVIRTQTATGIRCVLYKKYADKQVISRSIAVRHN